MDAVLIILQFFVNRQLTVLMGLTLFFRLALRTKGPEGRINTLIRGTNANSQSANLNCCNIPYLQPPDLTTAAGAAGPLRRYFRTCRPRAHGLPNQRLLWPNMMRWPHPQKRIQAQPVRRVLWWANH